MNTAAGRHEDQTGQSAEMDQQSALVRMAKEDVIGQRRQRHALPPAATSRERKSLIVVTPQRSATTAAMPRPSVEGNRPSGSCQIVWPGQPMHWTFCRLKLALIRDAPRRRRECFAEQTMQSTDLPDLTRRRSADRGGSGAQFLAIRPMQSLHLPHAQFQSDAFQLHQRGVHAIDAGTGGQTDEPAGTWMIPLPRCGQPAAPAREGVLLALRAGKEGFVLMPPVAAAEPDAGTPG